MVTVDRLRRLMADPVGMLRRRLRPVAQGAGAGPDLALLRNYGQKARASGFEQLYLFLSFDCDTDQDISASTEIHAFLAALGIKMTMAVPGTQLHRGADTYAALAAKGVEFINHGFQPHAEWSDDRYVSATFYHEMPAEAVEADMRAGDAAVRDVIGRAPLGFRAPHFGMFQAPAQLALVHSVAQRLGYSYCSTTIPSYGHAHGPAVDVGGEVIELPTFGSAHAPTTILDSWTYLTDRRDYVLGADYEELLVETVEVMLRHSIPGLLTWYADPSHVVGQAPFYRAMEHVARRGIESLHGNECVGFARRARA